MAIVLNKFSATHCQTHDTSEVSEKFDKTFVFFTHSQPILTLPFNPTSTCDSDASNFIQRSRNKDLLGTYQEHKVTLLRMNNLPYIDHIFKSWKQSEDESCNRSGNTLIRRDALMHCFLSC